VLLERGGKKNCGGLDEWQGEANWEIHKIVSDRGERWIQEKEGPHHEWVGGVFATPIVTPRLREIRTQGAYPRATLSHPGMSRREKKYA